MYYELTKRKEIDFFIFTLKEILSLTKNQNRLRGFISLKLYMKNHQKDQILTQRFFFCISDKNQYLKQKSGNFFLKKERKEIGFILPTHFKSLILKKKIFDKKGIKEIVCQNNLKQSPKKLMWFYQKKKGRKTSGSDKVKLETSSNANLKFSNKKVFLKIFGKNLKFFSEIFVEKKSVKEIFWKKMIIYANPSLKNLGKVYFKNIFFSDSFMALAGFSKTKVLKEQVRLSINRTKLNYY